MGTGVYLGTGLGLRGIVDFVFGCFEGVLAAGGGLPEDLLLGLGVPGGLLGGFDALDLEVVVGGTSAVEYLTFADAGAEHSSGAAQLIARLDYCVFVLLVDLLGLFGDKTMHELLNRVFLPRVLLLLQHPQVLLGGLEERRQGVGLANEVVLDLLQHLLLPLFQGSNSSCGIASDDLLDVAVEQFDGEESDFVVDPVGLALVEGFHYLVVSLLFSFAVVLQQIDEISLLEVATHPVLLGCVPQDTVSFKDTVFELADVKIAIFEPFFAKSVQLRIRHVPSFDDL